MTWSDTERRPPLTSPGERPSLTAIRRSQPPPPKKLLELRNKSTKVLGCKINVQNFVIFLYTNHEISQREFKTPIHNCITKNKTPGNKLNQGDERPILWNDKTMKETENTTKWKEIPCSWIGEILLKCPYYPRQSINAMQTLSKYPSHLKKFYIFQLEDNFTHDILASSTRCTWVWVNSGSWWWTGRPGMLWFMGSQRVGHDLVTELNWTENKNPITSLEPQKIANSQSNLEGKEQSCKISCSLTSDYTTKLW